MENSSIPGGTELIYCREEVQSVAIYISVFRSAQLHLECGVPVGRERIEINYLTDPSSANVTAWWVQGMELCGPRQRLQMPFCLYPCKRPHLRARAAICLAAYEAGSTAHNSCHHLWRAASTDPK